MTLIDEPVRHGTIYSGGRAGGTVRALIPSRQITLASR